MKKTKSAIAFIVFIAIVALLGYYTFGIVKGTLAKDSDKGIKLGLDLAGGVSITYQVAGDETPSAEDMSDTVYQMQQRVSAYSTEAEAYQVGDDRIAIEIPGVSDAASILEELGTPGSLEFQTTDGEVYMTGDDVKDAQAGTYTDSTTGSTVYCVELTLTDEGAEIFSEYTGNYVGDYLPIYYDGECITYPEVQSQITDGVAQITGMDSYEDAEILATQIRSGALKVELEELQSEVVGAKLGSQALSSSVLAAVIGILIIIAFMIIVYRIPGLAASIALLIYTGIVLAVLHLYHVTLTLPGIAGIILSIGMAVDANIIIFARIREEIASGKSVNNSITIGFKKAFSAILDGNVTTLIAAAVLGIRGSGTIRGFAITLAIGIVFSMFTALAVSRWIMRALYGMGFQDKKFYGEKKEKKSIDFMGKRFLCMGISLAVIVAGFIGMGAFKATSGQPLNFSLEFMGGTSTTVTFAEDYTIEEIDGEIVPYIEEVTGDADIQTQKVETETDEDSEGCSIIFKTGELSQDQRSQFAETMETNFGVTGDDIVYQNISSTISSEMRSDAVWAVVIAAICMLIYIWFRFKNLRFAASSILPLIHDVLIVLAFYALSRTSVGTTFIACMLTLIGYSINATIVVFDRIREHLNEQAGNRNIDLKEITNLSITQTLSRSINTSLTVFIMVFMIYILGVSSIREFAGPLMVGVICGGYSSVCLAGAFWYMMTNHKMKREQAAAEAAKAAKSASKKKKKK